MAGLDRLGPAIDPRPLEKQDDRSYSFDMGRPNVRQKIVDAALKVLIEKGFNGCGVQDITAAAGVPKGSFYNHFESKEALGAEVVECYGRDNPRRAALADTSIPAMQRLRAHF